LLPLCSIMEGLIKVTLPDGSVREYPQGCTALDVASSISEGLARNVLAAKVDGSVQDAMRILPATCELQLLTWNDSEGKSTMWHSSAHLMAEALEFYFPGVKLAIGPPVANGFYYDVDFMDYTFTEKDLEKVEAKMKELAKLKNPYIRQEVSKQDALNYFTEKQDPYKLELINELADGTITFYTHVILLTCVEVHTFLIPVISKRLSSCRLLGPIGEVTKKISS